jgi:GMP synthase-like glutamine amidotransferase
MRVLCLTHEDDGPAGLFAEVVRERGDEILEWNVSQGPPPEPPESFDALIVFGGSMHVDQEDRHPWLTGQLDLIRQAVERSQPLLGVCLGGQMLARASGAHVGPAARP